MAGIENRDPIPRYEKALRDAGLLDDTEASRIREEARAKVEDAITFAKDSPEPDPATALSYVFA